MFTMTKVVVISSLVWIFTTKALGAVNNSAANEATLIIYRFPEDLGVNFNKTEESAGRSFNAWSILWYVGSFVGLIAFFFIISFSEWCCKRRLWNRRNTRNAPSTASQNGVNDPAPPAYDLFAPPSYDSIYKDGSDEKPQFDVYVVPINTGEELGPQFCSSLINDSRTTNTDETTAPPSYTSTADLTSGGNREDSEETTSTQTEEDASSKTGAEKRTKRRAPQPSSSSVVVSLEDPRDDGGGKTSLQ